MGAAGRVHASGCASPGLRLWGLKQFFLFWGFLMVKKRRRTRGWGEGDDAWQSVCGGVCWDRCCLPSPGQPRLPSVAFRRRRAAPYWGGPPLCPAAGVSAAPWRCVCGRSPHRSSTAFVLQQEVESRGGFAERKHRWDPCATGMEPNCHEAFVTSAQS